MRVKCRFNLLFVLLLPCLLAAILSSCKKGGSEVTAPYIASIHDAIDTPAIKAYLSSHTTLDTIVLNNVKKSDSTQLRYMLVPLARGDSSHNPHPTIDSGVVFNYSLRILSRNSAGAIIDSVGTPGYSVSPLNETLPGISEGIQYLHRGQRILLFLPSSLGFRDNPTDVTYNMLTGAQKVTIVPANSILIFDITLTGVTRLLVP